MLKLHGNAIYKSVNFVQRKLFIVTSDDSMHPSIRSNYAFILSDDKSYKFGFGAYLGMNDSVNRNIENYIQIPNEMSFLEVGDIIRIEPNGYINILFRKNSHHNTILLTERCNHYCLMCSQPPKNIDDSWLMDEALSLLERIPTDTVNIGFSGGEPTLYGDRFIELIQKSKSCLPSTSVDVLTNGRKFCDYGFASRFASIAHPDCVLGIPIYSDDATRHDYVVQSNGAFNETIEGIINLKKLQQKVEVRVVIHKQTVQRLVQTCEFITRNLLFVDHVALMGLEMMGFARANLDDLWIDPYEYKDILSESVAVLSAYGLNVSVYNHQLCIVNSDVVPYYKKSISDWKNEYLDECVGCSRSQECGGLFSSSKLHKYSSHIKSFSVNHE